MTAERSAHSRSGGMFLALLAFYIAVLPIGGTIAARNFAFAAILGITAWSVLKERLRLSLPISHAWLAYGVVCGISLSYALDPAYSWGEFKVEVLFCVALFAVCHSWSRGRDMIVPLAWFIALGSAFMALGSAWLAATQGVNWVTGHGSWNSGVGNYSTYVVTVAPWIAALALHAWQEGRRATAMSLSLLLVANLGTLFLTMNRQGSLALAAAGTVGIALASRRLPGRTRFTLLAAAMVAMSLFLLAQFQLRFADTPKSADQAQAVAIASKDPRWPAWRFAFEQIAATPWSGGGMGRAAFQIRFPDFASSHPPFWHAHNMVINKGVQMGIPGMAAFLALWLALAAALLRAHRTPGARLWTGAALAMCAGVFVKNMTDDFFMRDLALLFWLLAGAALGAAARAGQGRAAA